MKREIKGFPNYYITNDGRVVSKRKGGEISKWVDNVGYYQCVLYREGKRCYKRVHRLMGENFLMSDNHNIGLEVNHMDGNKLNNNIDNLELVESHENTQHGYEKGLYKTNKRNIPIQVIEKNTKETVGIYKSIRQLSKELELNRKTVSAIIFNNKNNNTRYLFKPTIEEDFYYIAIYRDDKHIKTVPSMIQASEVTGVDRHKISEILKGKSRNNTAYEFIKKYKEQEQASAETIESIA